MAKFITAKEAAQLIPDSCNSWCCRYGTFRLAGGGCMCDP